MQTRPDDHIFDAKTARSFYAGTHYYCGDKFDSTYAPGYVISNEDIHTVTNTIKTPLRSVLTVAASGDQPMFYALRGAKHIDTFDVTACACAIMDIKTSAIHKLNRSEYAALLDNLCTSIYPAITAHAILRDIPPRTAELLLGTPNCGLFTRGFGPSMYTYNMPTDAEYDQMRQTIKKPFNFIWSDITNLHMHLAQQYDMINISNIPEYLPLAQVGPTIKTLHMHLNIGGYIQTTLMNNDRRIIKIFNQVAKQYDNWGRIEIQNLHPYKILLLQRTR